MWLDEHFHDNNILDRSYFTDEACVYLSGNVDYQNYRIWFIESLYELIETNVHPGKVRDRVPTCRRRITYLAFTYCYLLLILLVIHR